MFHALLMEFIGMFHDFVYYILGLYVSRETLSCVFSFSYLKMFHVKHVQLGILILNSNTALQYCF